jgi:hypothetical protein
MLFPDSNKISDRIKVVNKYKVKSKYVDIMIGGGTALGNPYALSPDLGQQEKVDRFAEYLGRQLKVRKGVARKEMEEFLDRIMAGETIRLGCCCKPKPCHGDVIKNRLVKAANRRLRRESEKRKEKTNVKRNDG